MDDVLTEGLEILDSDSIRTTDKVVQKSKDVANRAIKNHKIQKKFIKKQREEQNNSKVRFGLKQKYKGNTRVTEIHQRGKPAERLIHRTKILNGLKRTAVDTDLVRWCKLSGSKHLKEEVKSEEEEESAFDDAYFAQFEKQYLDK